MARKKKVTIIETPEDDETVEVPLNADDEETIHDEEESREVLAELRERFPDQAVRILVEKYDAEGDWATCKKYPFRTFDQEHVKEEFGGGRYRGSLYNAKGIYIKGGRFHFKFAESVKREGPVYVKPENPLENPAVVMMIKSMEQNQANMMAFFQTLMAAQNQGVSAQKAPMSEMLEAVKSLRSMVPQDAKPFESVKEMLTMLKLLNEVKGDGGESKEGLLSDIKEFLSVWPTIQESLPKLKEIVPAPPALAPAGTVPGAPPMDPISQKVVAHVPEFIDAAKAAQPHEKWGQYLLDIFEEEFLPLLVPVLTKKYKPFVRDEDDAYDMIIKMASDSDEREKIFKAIPPLAPHRDWVLKVIDEAVRLSEIDPEGGETMKPNSGGGSVILTAVPANGAEKH